MLHIRFADNSGSRIVDDVCDFAVEFLKWPELMHSIDPANTRSQALATRLGARNGGPTRLPAPFEDAPVDAWTQSADAWRSKRKEFRP